MLPRTWQPLTSRQRALCSPGSLLGLTSAGTSSTLSLLSAPSTWVHRGTPQTMSRCYHPRTHCDLSCLSSLRRWFWVPPPCPTTWPTSAPQQNIQWSWKLSLVPREARSSLRSSPPVSPLIHISVWRQNQMFTSSLQHHSIAGQTSHLMIVFL